MTTKNVWRGKEFIFYNYLKSLQDDLRNDFLSAKPQDLKTWDNTPKWNMWPLRYDVERSHPERDKLIELSKNLQLTSADQYPTVYNNILKKWDKECNICGYTILEPGGIITKHADYENFLGNMIRIHIPLINPEGDAGMEICGELVDWSDIFAFASQRVHSVWNFTKTARLILMLDLPRDICGLPSGEPTNFENMQAEELLFPFPKTEVKE